MVYLIRTALILWLLTSIFILTSINSGETHPCDIPIVRSLGRQTYTEQITDYRTGIQLTQEFNYHTVHMSPDETHIYVIRGESENTKELYIYNVEQDLLRLLYTTDFDIDPYWSVDGRSVFVYEYETAGESQTARRLIAIDITSGDIWFEFIFSTPIRNGLSGRSPDNHYFYVNDAGKRASIDSATGEITFFTQSLPQDYQLWSLDNTWLIRGSIDQMFVTHAKTGELHPQLNQAIDGRYPQWTENSIWFTRSENGLSSVWRASLLDGSIEREHLNMSLRFVSPDDRWRVLVPPDDETESISYIYDNQTDMTYPETNVSWVDFSDNGRCMLIIKLLSFNPRSSELLVYDLQTMDEVMRRNLGIRRTFRFFYNYQWYDEQYFESVEGLYTLLD